MKINPLSPISLDMSDPLTLGVNLRMSHPVTERIRRLSMRKTNTIMRCGTAAFIFAAIGATTPILSTASAEPILTTVQDKVQQSLTLPDAPDTPAIEKRAEAPDAPSPSAQIAPSQTNLTPMRLRFYRVGDLNQKDYNKIETARKAYKGGDTSSAKTISGIVIETNKRNRFQFAINDQKQASFMTYKNQASGIGYPLDNVSWDERPLSNSIRQAINGAMRRCESAKSPSYFMANINSNDTVLGQGEFEVECILGSESTQKDATNIELAKAYLASDELPLAKRQSVFQFMMMFAKMDDYVRLNPSATFADDRAACVKIYTDLKQYDFIAKAPDGMNRMLENCPNTNYNYRRRRAGLPEITQ